MEFEQESKDFTAAIVSALCAERKRQELSLYRLSELSGITREGLRLIEAGERSPSLQTLYVIARALDVDFVEIVRSAW